MGRRTVHRGNHGPFRSSPGRRRPSRPARGTSLCVCGSTDRWVDEIVRAPGGGGRVTGTVDDDDGDGGVKSGVHARTRTRTTTTRPRCPCPYLPGNQISRRRAAGRWPAVAPERRRSRPGARARPFPRPFLVLSLSLTHAVSHSLTSQQLNHGDLDHEHSRRRRFNFFPSLVVHTWLATIEQSPSSVRTDTCFRYVEAGPPRRDRRRRRNVSRSRRILDRSGL